MMNLKDKGHKKMTFIFFIFWFFVLKKIFGDEKRGATTTPLLSAECQIESQSELKRRATRVTRVNKK